MGVSQNYGYHFGGPNNKDYSILGSILGSPYSGKVPLVFGFKGVGWFKGLGFRVYGFGFGV